MDYLIKFLSRILTWLFDFFKWVVEWTWHEVLGALGTLLAAIPVPQWLSDASGLLAQIPSGVVWGFNIFQVKQGITIIVSAYVLRFLIRRIPFVG